jgi:transposase-like protein
MHQSNAEEFNTWYDSFIKQTGGLKVPPYWFEQVEKQHVSLRDKLDGLRKSFKVELDTTEAQCKFADIAKEGREIYTLIPNYFSHYGYSLAILQQATLTVGSEVGMKVSKHISTWMDRSSVDKDVKEQVCILISKLGNIWSKSRSKKDELYVTVSTTPKAFALIGHYGPDNGSCFRQCAQNQLHKYRLGAFLNSCVILVSRQPIEEKIAPPTVITRFWAAANDKVNIISVCNAYISADYPSHGNIYIAVEKAISELCGAEIAKIPNAVSISGQATYLNGGHFVLHDKSLKSVGRQDLAISTERLEEVIKCPLCGITSIRDKSKIIDGNHACYECAAKAKYCEYSKQYTVKPMIPAIDEKGNKIEVCKTALDQKFFKCMMTKEYHHMDNHALFKGGFVSLLWLKANGMIKCPYCDLYDYPKEFKINKDVFEDKKVCSQCQYISKNVELDDIWDFEPEELVVA